MCSDGWEAIVLIYLQVGYCFDLSAVKENAIISIENGLVSHKEIVPGNNDNNNKPTIRADNGSQYTLLYCIQKIGVDIRTKTRTHRL